MDIVKEMSDKVIDNDSLSSVHSGIGLLKNIEKELLNNNIYHGRYSKHNDLNFHIALQLQETKHSLPCNSFSQMWILQVFQRTQSNFTD